MVSSACYSTKLQCQDSVQSKYKVSSSLSPDSELFFSSQNLSRHILKFNCLFTLSFSISLIFSITSKPSQLWFHRQNSLCLSFLQARHTELTTGELLSAHLKTQRLTTSTARQEQRWGLMSCGAAQPALHSSILMMLAHFAVLPVSPPLGEFNLCYVLMLFANS